MAPVAVLAPYVHSPTEAAFVAQAHRIAPKIVGTDERLASRAANTCSSLSEPHSKAVEWPLSGSRRARTPLRAPRRRSSLRPPGRRFVWADEADFWRLTIFESASNISCRSGCSLQEDYRVPALPRRRVCDRRGIVAGGIGFLGVTAATASPEHRLRPTPVRWTPPLAGKASPRPTPAPISAPAYSSSSGPTSLVQLAGLRCAHLLSAHNILLGRPWCLPTCPTWTTPAGCLSVHRPGTPQRETGGFRLLARSG